MSNYPQYPRSGYPSHEYTSQTPAPTGYSAIPPPSQARRATTTLPAGQSAWAAPPPPQQQYQHHLHYSPIETGLRSPTSPGRVVPPPPSFRPPPSLTSPENYHKSALRLDHPILPALHSPVSGGYDSLQAENARLRQELDEMRRTIEDNKKEFDEVKRQRDSFRQQLGVVMVDLQGTKRSLDNVLAELDHAKAKRDKYAKQRDGLKETVMRWQHQERLREVRMYHGGMEQK